MSLNPPLFLFAALALAACSGGAGSSSSRTDAATQAACRQRAEQIDTQRNRADIYRPQAEVNTPFSAAYAPGVSDRGLSDIFVHDKLIADCVRTTGTGEDRTPPDTGLAPPPPP